jgi:uncharacterized protein
MFQNLKNTLDAQNALPGIYMFKFIAPEDKQEEVIALFNPHDVTSRSSRNGRYVSLTAQVFMHSSQDVIDILAHAAKIPGVISL